MHILIYTYIYSATSTPVPQDVSNPSQYQNGPNGQPLNGASYSQSAPAGPPSSMSAYHTAIGGGSQRPNDERVSTPQLPIVNHASHESSHHNGPPRDLPPMPSHGGDGSPGPYPSTSSREDVRIPDIGGGGRAPTPSERSQMNPILQEDRHNNLPPMAAMRYKQQQQQDEKRSPVHTSSPRPRVPFDRLSPRSAHSDSYRSSPVMMEASPRARSEQIGRLHTPKPEEPLNKGGEEVKDYDESAADALLSMGQPQLAIGQKRPLQQPELEETKKPKMAATASEETALEDENKTHVPPSSAAA
ncbi:hypothetical protein K501DRAFT_101373 [Backusella circina FSU 941]|nr:hypothetical protein K501DRAFT_101373 [Backusella circina FSU 941]